MSYKWASPQEWLLDKIRRNATTNTPEGTELLGIANTLAGLCDNDSIQDAFQEEMDEDSYFSEDTEEEEETESCPDCESDLVPVMVDTDGTNLEEGKECQNPDCESRETPEKNTETDSPVLVWDTSEMVHSDDVDHEWECLCEALTTLMKTMSDEHRWYACVENFGWDERCGSQVLNAENGAELLEKLLPKCDCTFKIYLGENGCLRINNAHHDSPTWAEWYYICENVESRRNKMKEDYNIS